MVPGRRSVSRARFERDSTLVNFKFGPVAGLRLAAKLILRLTQCESGRKPDRKPGIYSGKPRNQGWIANLRTREPGTPKGLGSRRNVFNYGSQGCVQNLARKTWSQVSNLKSCGDLERNTTLQHDRFPTLNKFKLPPKVQPHGVTPRIRAGSGPRRSIS
jgi:hypothetical protein